MIFLSHNYKDKPFVEHIATKLSEVYGVDRVFYDSWSIRPGDGIIDKMNEGLANAEFFFFFISKDSLSSKMVSIEWQNALMNATHKKLKFIPIKCDDTVLPALLTQTVYLNLYMGGVDAVVEQMIALINGGNGFQPSGEAFSNLSYSIHQKEDKIGLIISASHFHEPNTNFMVIFSEHIDKENFRFEVVGEPGFHFGFQPSLTLDNGFKTSGCHFALMHGISKGMPMKLRLWTVSGKKLEVITVLHQKNENRYEPIPRKIDGCDNHDYSQKMY